MSSSSTCPRSAASVTVGGVIGEVESTKSVSEIYAPVAGTISAVNETLTSSPELVNSDPYGEGWICEIATTSIQRLRRAARRGCVRGTHDKLAPAFISKVH